MVITIRGHEYDYSGESIIPCTDEAEAYFGDIFEVGQSAMRYGRYSAWIVHNAQLVLALPRLDMEEERANAVAEFAAAIEAAGPLVAAEREKQPR